MNRFYKTGLIILIFYFNFAGYLSGRGNTPGENIKTNFINYHNIDKTRQITRGRGVKVVVLDWMFNIKSDSSGKYINPVSLVPNQDIGAYQPWHGEWMAEIIHQIAPDCKIIPVRARPASVENEDALSEKPYEKYIIEGIRLAADKGAVAVTNSMGPLKQSEELNKAVRYAEKRGTVFIDVHPEYLKIENKRYVLCDSVQLNSLIVHCGIVSVPEYPRKPDPLRDIYTWPYQINPVYKDGWGYSNGPPIVAGVIALMKAVNSDLSVRQIKNILIRTARNENGFKVLDAEAAVKESFKCKEISLEK